MNIPRRVPLSEELPDIRPKRPSRPAPGGDALPIATAVRHPYDDLRLLLEVCTKETPFKNSGQEYIQEETVSMGSPLRPTFAHFYMSHVESTLLSQSSF